jgi:hypothetical protein
MKNADANMDMMKLDSYDRKYKARKAIKRQGTGDSK